ncbi:hypothetical protein [Fodinicola feengrottensis]|uniref:Uncharacterized protein n=1 Tax=Fodinicola feengrottensis TaxID=435914 RepID=A0ABN2IVC0_9ACTN|nr:hypothetical protein [Fodinicola feengrottensis]
MNNNLESLYKDAAALDELYFWLADESFGLDWVPDERPIWLDMYRLAQAYAHSAEGTLAEDWVAVIQLETGWEIGNAYLEDDPGDQDDLRVAPLAARDHRDDEAHASETRDISPRVS